MELSQLSQGFQQNTVAVVFANVLLQQVGVPIPVVPTLLLAGSLAATSGQLAELLAAAVFASLIADGIWYSMGTHFGYRVLAGLCRLSINPESCVTETEARFVRWGVSSLIFAKFIPGFSIVASPIAGALRLNLLAFLAAAGTGAFLLFGSALGAGWILKDSVQTAIDVLRHQAIWATLAALLAGGAWLGAKLWRKYRFRRESAIPHITPEELLRALDSEHRPLFLDLRGATMIGETGLIPKATVAEHARLDNAVGNWPKHAPIVTMCACPEDAGAIKAARHLLNLGYLSVRPLKGGYDAYMHAMGLTSSAGLGTAI